MTQKTMMFCDAPNCDTSVEVVDNVALTVIARGWLNLRPTGAPSAWTFCSYACLGGFVAEKLKTQMLNQPLENMIITKETT